METLMLLLISTGILSLVVLVLLVFSPKKRIPPYRANIRNDIRKIREQIL